MQVHRIQNSNYNSSFGARIIMSNYLDAGLKYAKEHASLQEKDQFLNALRHIANDSDIETFSIKAVEGSRIRPGQARKSIIEVKGKQSYSYENDGFVGYIFDGPQCMSAVIHFIARHYDCKAANKLLDKQNQWLVKIDELEHQVSIATDKARQELNKGLNELMKQIKADK